MTHSCLEMTEDVKRYVCLCSTNELVDGAFGLCSTKEYQDASLMETKIVTFADIQ